MVTKNDKRAIVLMDIDGVLNIFGARGANPHQRSSMAAGYRLVLDRRHPGWVARLAEHAELRWATMWTDRARTDFAPVAGFGANWPVLDFHAYWRNVGGEREFQLRWGAGVGDTKWPVIHQLMRGDRPLIWIDDDMTDDQLRMAERRNAVGLPTLFIRPDPREGWTLRQFQQVLRFVSDPVEPTESSTTPDPELAGVAA